MRYLKINFLLADMTRILCLTFGPDLYNLNEVINDEVEQIQQVQDLRERFLYHKILVNSTNIYVDHPRLESKVIHN
jgi:hypothetical protein